MTLTFSGAPLSATPAGQFNFSADTLQSVIYWEPYPKRLRVELNGRVVADSRGVRALHESGKMMVLYVPFGDVDLSCLARGSRRSATPLLGMASQWTVSVDGLTAEDAAWSHDQPPEAAGFVRGFMGFALDKMGAWYLEEERGYAHPRDPYHRFDVHRGAQYVVVRHAGQIVAETRRPQLLFETGSPTRYYLPAEDVRVELLTSSATVSQCPYKGDGQHWNLRTAKGRAVADAAWTLPRPLVEANVVADHFCFYSERVDVVVDGVRLKN